MRQTTATGSACSGDSATSSCTRCCPSLAFPPRTYEHVINTGTAVVTHKLEGPYCAGVACQANTTLQGGEAPRHVRSNTLFSVFKLAVKAASGALAARRSQKLSQLRDGR